MQHLVELMCYENITNVTHMVTWQEQLIFGLDIHSKDMHVDALTPVPCVGPSEIA